MWFTHSESTTTVFLAGGREHKLVTGVDDHSRFVVITKVVAEPSESRGLRDLGPRIQAARDHGAGGLARVVES
jgi:hypothetical protein